MLSVLHVHRRNTRGYSPHPTLQWGMVLHWMLHPPVLQTVDVAAERVAWIDGMTTPQIILYVLILLILVLYVRRRLQLRGLTSYSPGEVSERVKQGSSLLLDVRTNAERQRKSITGSLHIPLHELGQRMKELDKHKSREIICYCQSGNRSISATVRLKKSGFTAANMNGGISEWISSGLK